MRIPLTKYGRPEVVAYPLGILLAMLAAFFLRNFICPQWFFYVIEGVFLVVLLWVFSFFRDPKRKIPQGSDILLSPADGTISDIDVIRKVDGFDGPVLRIGIFLSVFNVHINRVPCDVKIGKIKYKIGQFKNALDPESTKVNEANDVFMEKTSEPTDKLLVRQISGAIARRIVCAIAEGEKLVSGQQFGMIKFGSRTELYVGMPDAVECLVKKGDKVKAGLTILAKYSQK